MSVKACANPRRLKKQEKSPLSPVSCALCSARICTGLNGHIPYLTAFVHFALTCKVQRLHILRLNSDDTGFQNRYIPRFHPAGIPRPTAYLPCLPDIPYRPPPSAVLPQNLALSLPIDCCHNFRIREFPVFTSSNSLFPTNDLYRMVSVEA